MWHFQTVIQSNFLRFLLTHPVWDVTLHINAPAYIRAISTHTSRVGCDLRAVVACLQFEISTHTSRVGCDVFFSHCYSFLNIFLLTHPVWDVTSAVNVWYHTESISTHTSRVGCDSFCTTAYAREEEFLLTHPVWDVTRGSHTYDSREIFLLTHPVWDVTRKR